MTKEDKLSNIVIGAAIEVHRALGPGLLESTYEACLAYELISQGIPFERQKPLPVVYKGEQLDCGYRVDLLVDRCVIVEIKAQETLLRLHEAQILTYLKLTGFKLGLLLNFNVPVMKDGIKRVVLGL
ncbi:MAG: GxxExxY protein [Planctomycetes bacterium DG_23]|nr:MAG: GxxExxY protein [Planctomycetes bacterium DG_23]